MIELTFWRKVFIVVIVALAFAGGVSLGWIGRGLNEPVGGIPTTAAMQMVVEIEAEPSATSAPTVGAPTSKAAPTQAQPTQTPTASTTLERAEWEIDCPVKLVGTLVECMDLMTRGSKEPGVARLYWIGECLPYGTLITLWKQGDDEGWRELYQGPEWSWAFDPNECSRETEVPSPNHIVLKTMAGPGTYKISVRVGGHALLLESFYWNAPMATVPTSTPSPTVTATSQITVEWVTRVSPFNYGGVCIYAVQLDGNYYWATQGADWSLWDTKVIGEAQYAVLGFDEVSGEIRWLIGDTSDPCVSGGLLAGVAGLESYLTAIGREDLEIPPPPPGLGVNDLED
jgi:hypothetical protein